MINHDSWTNPCAEKTADQQRCEPHPLLGPIDPVNLFSAIDPQNPQNPSSQKWFKESLRYARTVLRVKNPMGLTSKDVRSTIKPLNSPEIPADHRTPSGDPWEVAVWASESGRCCDVPLGTLGICQISRCIRCRDSRATEAHGVPNRSLNIWIPVLVLKVLHTMVNLDRESTSSTFTWSLKLLRRYHSLNFHQKINPKVK